MPIEGGIDYLNPSDIQSIEAVSYTHLRVPLLMSSEGVGFCEYAAGDTNIMDSTASIVYLTDPVSYTHL